MTLEESLEYLSDDEYLEVTPESIRLRKKELDKAAREKAARKAKYSEEQKLKKLSKQVTVSKVFFVKKNYCIFKEKMY